MNTKIKIFFSLSMILFTALIISSSVVEANEGVYYGWEGLFVDGELSDEITLDRYELGQRLLNVFDSAIEELEFYANLENEPEFSPFSLTVPTTVLDLSISRIVELRDFAGDIFTLIEMYPTGYMIYHNESGIFTERSATALSPFLGFYGDLYFGGFLQYFYGKNNYAIKCLTTGYIVDRHIIEEFNWNEYSIELADNLLTYTDYFVLDYVLYGIPVPPMVSFSATTWRNVADSTFISRQTVRQTGHNALGEGHCAFVALAILIGYFDHRSANRQMGLINGNLTPARVQNRHTASALVQANFVEDLRVIGDNIGVGRQGLTITQTRNVGRRYFENRGVWNRITDTLHTTRLTTTNTRITNHINANRPVILSSDGLPGTSGKIGGHAVVGFGHRNESNGSFTVRVNYGWGNTAEISGGASVGTRTANDVWITGFDWRGLLTFTVTP